MNWRKTLSRGASASKGFTLIELMIVIAIIGILAAVAIPNFLRARDRGRFSACVSTLTGVKTAVEMVAADDPGDNGPYEKAVWGNDRICREMMQSETCGDIADLQPRIDNNCSSFSLDVADPTTYTIKGLAKDKFQCGICVTPVGTCPRIYGETNCGRDECLTAALTKCTE